MGDRTIAQVQSQLSRTVRNFIAGPREQESGADGRAVGLHPLKSSASPRRTVKPTIAGVYDSGGQIVVPRNQ